MKSVLKNVKYHKFNLNGLPFKNFCASKGSDGSINLRFHELYVKELERIQKTT